MAPAVPLPQMMTLQPVSDINHASCWMGTCKQERECQAEGQLGFHRATAITQWCNNAQAAADTCENNSQLSMLNARQRYYQYREQNRQ